MLVRDCSSFSASVRDCSSLAFVVCFDLFVGVCFFVVDCLMVGANSSLRGVRWLMLVDGCCGWLLVFACWLVVGGWRLVVGGWLLLVVGCPLFLVGCW